LDDYSTLTKTMAKPIEWRGIGTVLDYMRVRITDTDEVQRHHGDARTLGGGGTLDQPPRRGDVAQAGGVMPPRRAPERFWRPYGIDLPSPAEALAVSLSAFPSRFLRIECERCDRAVMINEAHATLATSVRGSTTQPLPDLSRREAARSVRQPFA
jgi:hypothetical protein